MSESDYMRFVSTLSDLLEEAKNPPPMKHWKHLKSIKVLRYVKQCYDVDLESVKDWVDLVDWIFHVHGRFEAEAYVEFVEFLQWYSPNHMEGFNKCRWDRSRFLESIGTL